MIKALRDEAKQCGEEAVAAGDTIDGKVFGRLNLVLSRLADRIERPAQAEGAVAEQGPFPCKCTRLTLACRWPNCEAGTTKAEPLAAPAQAEGADHPDHLPTRPAKTACPLCGSYGSSGCLVPNCPAADGWAQRATKTRWENDTKRGTVKTAELVTPATTQPIEAIQAARKARVIIAAVIHRYGKQLLTTATGDVADEIIDALLSDGLAIRAALAVQPAPDKPVDPGSLTDTATPGEIERIGHVIQLWAKSLRDDPAKFAGYIIRTLDHYRKTAAGPSIADLKPGQWLNADPDDGYSLVQGFAIINDDDKSVQISGKIVKSWPATDGGTG